MKNILTGKTLKHLTCDPHSKLYVHKEALLSLQNLRRQASSFGFALEMTSAFRSFDQQLEIWNAKARGLRTLYDDQGMKLDYNLLSPKEIVFSILRWSALPGASRHHWGTDIDVYDKSRLPVGYQVQLLPQETEPSGVFGEFHLWLDQNIDDFDFFRPYSIDRGGIAPERWHLSYSPTADLYQGLMSFDLIEETIKISEIEFKEIILQELPDIFRRFIML